MRIDRMKAPESSEVGNAKGGRRDCREDHPRIAVEGFAEDPGRR
jgi:hypothetical protein